MKNYIPYLIATVFLALTHPVVADDSATGVPKAPRIASVQMVDPQPQEEDQSVIWYDDFDDDARQDQYPEKSGDTTAEVRFGETGKSLHMHYPKGSRGIGGRKVFFGDSPTYQPKTARRGDTFEDVYWRIYVKHQQGWTGGGPAKLSRATSLVPPGWRQSMIAHVWSSGEALTLDPASGVRGDRVVTTRYNDFDNLRWLGNKPVSRFKLHGSEGAGWWVCVEGRAKLNGPGKKDGVNQLWIDGRLEAQRQGLDWRGAYTGHGINAVFLEAYWNQGSPVDQSRWIDNFVVSTKPIGPVVSTSNPVLMKSPYQGPGSQRSWIVEVAVDAPGRSVVWQSDQLRDTSRVKVETTEGHFVNALEGKRRLAGDENYIVRARQQSSSRQWSGWSDWHQRFRTETNAN